jgi:hypothetical protein
MLEAFIDAPQHHERLTVFPVIAPRGPMLPFLLSTEIQGSGTLTLRERSAESPPTLLAKNSSLHPLLILAGEPIPGGNPGRVLERSVLLAGKRVTQIPAPSTERGGWVMPDREREITEWLNHFPIRKQQVGLLVFHGDRILGLEALGSANLYSPLHRRLLIRFMKEALAAPTQFETRLTSLEAEAQRLVDAIEEADRAAKRKAGIGDYWTLTGPVSGGELIYEGHLVHLSVRPVQVAAAASTNQEGSG